MNPTEFKMYRKLLIMVKSTFATSPKILYVVYPKWAHSSVEQAHNPWNQEITWFPRYNVIHRATSTFSNCPSVWRYLFFHPHLIFVWSVTEIFSHLDNLVDLKQSRWICDLGGLFCIDFFTKDFCHVYSCYSMY